MRYLTIQRIPVPVSKIALGSTYFGTTIPEKTVMAMLDAFATANGTALDTARVYGQDYPGGPSPSESVIGKWLSETGMRKRMVLATKGMHPSGDGKSRFTYRDLMNDIEMSQESLGSETFDIWFLHRDDPQVPVGEIMDMMAPLVQSGIIRVLGASNWTTGRIEAANAYATAHGLPTFATSEIQWSLASSTPESWNDSSLVCMDSDSLVWYRKERMPIFAFSSQSKGFFSKAIAHGLAGLNEKSRSRFLNPDNEAKIERVRTISENTGLSPAAIATGYITNEDPSSVAIVGCSSVGQLEDTLTGADVLLSPSQLDYLAGERQDAT